MKRLAALPLLLVLAAACGSSQSSAPAQDRKLTVFAAASLSRVLPKLDGSVRYQFAGSNALQFQIEQGAPADVFVSASPKYLRQLQAEHLLLEPPALFATNRLVLIVPRRNPARIHTPSDLAGPGVRLVLAAVGVPAGDYARKALAAMHLRSALANVVSDEPDVEGVVTKVLQGEADAGFVYASDAGAVKEKVKVVPLPRSARQVAVYGAAVLKSAGQAQLGRGFVALLLSPPGQKELGLYGFGPAPRKKPLKK
jgi:molybdate transport system substrate-binding protein